MPNYQFWQKDLSPALQLVFLSLPSAVMCLPGAGLALNGESVYYDTSRGLYFYLEGSNWEVGASLPNTLRVRLGDYVSMELDTDKPYIHHKEHVKKFPPQKAKAKKKGRKG